MAVSKIPDNNLYLLNVIKIGASVASGNHGDIFSVSNSIPTGYSFMECILVTTPNSNWIRANAFKYSETQIEIVYTNEFTSTITGNWVVCLILERTSQ